MNSELIAPAAQLTLLILQRKPTVDMEWTNDVIADAFVQAAMSLQEGIRRVDREAGRQPMTSARTTGV